MAYYVIQLVGAFLASYSASIILEVPKKLSLKAGLTGLIGYIVYLFLLDQDNSLATLLACITVSFVGQFFARRYKTPVTIFYIPAFFLFVPGSAIYQTALNFIQGNVAESLNYLIQTISTAGSIALGIFLVDSAIEIYYRVKTLIKMRN